MFCTDLYAQLVLVYKISALELSWKLTKSALLVGYMSALGTTLFLSSLPCEKRSFLPSHGQLSLPSCKRGPFSQREDSQDLILTFDRSARSNVKTSTVVVQ